MKENASGGIGLTGVLFLVFLILELTHVINWSWWWVTAPLWIPVGLFLGVLALLAIVGGLIYYFKQ